MSASAVEDSGIPQPPIPLVSSGSVSLAEGCSHLPPPPVILPVSFEKVVSMPVRVPGAQPAISGQVADPLQQFLFGKMDGARVVVAPKPVEEEFNGMPTI